MIKDAISNEPIVGAIIIYGEGKNTSTDIDGAFSFSVDSGIYVVKASYIGYNAMNKKITAKGKPVFLDFTLSSNELAEVEVT
ncbi:MAG: carboxypeptidase-like regulatory domain-containing protein, partial [Bacteroidia bacterium]|nr:carboxypeptidase-like regulatory domain-containing protein [Bacteroidia bacterium]